MAHPSKAVKGSGGFRSLFFVRQEAEMWCGVDGKSYPRCVHAGIIIRLRESFLHNAKQIIVTARPVKFGGNLPQQMELVERNGGKVVMLHMIVGTEGIQGVEPTGIRRRARYAASSILVDGAAVIRHKHGRCRVGRDAPQQFR